MEFEITALFGYPVKSMRHVELQSALLNDFGVSIDRRFMLVDTSGKFVTARSYPLMSTISVDWKDNCLTLSHARFGTRHLKLEQFSQVTSVMVWGDSVSALKLAQPDAAFLSEFLQRDVNLVFMPESSFRQVDRDFFNDSQRVSFSDGFPLLLTNEASLNDLNARLDNPVDMLRFRPNVVVKGDVPFQEDDWKKVMIGDIPFDIVKPCSRCVMTTVNSEGVKSGSEPLKTLATYRKNDFGVCFGQNMVHRGLGNIKLGDKLVVLA